MQLIDQINDTFENNLGIFIDLSKAFDTVDHEILISKLNNYGVKGKNLSHFKSYLENGKQYLNYSNDVTMHRSNVASPRDHSLDLYYF